MGIPLISRSMSLQTNRNDGANDTLLFRGKQFPAQGIFGSFSSLLPLSWYWQWPRKLTSLDQWCVIAIPPSPGKTIWLATLGAVLRSSSLRFLVTHHASRSYQTRGSFARSRYVRMQQATALLSNLESTIW